MNWDQIEGNWNEWKVKIKRKWEKLTDKELDMIRGKKEELSGAIQKKYGVAKEEAEKQLRAFQDNVRVQ